LAVPWFASRDLRASRPDPVSLPTREILSKPGLYLLYAGLMSANIVLARAFATHAGSGMAAALDYSMRCVNVGVAYLVYPVANSLMPEIARLRANNETTHAYRLMSRSVGLMAVAAVISCGIALLLRKPAIEFLFERGSFTAESTVLVANVVAGLAPVLIGWTLMDLISRCCFALDRPRLPLIAAFVPVSVNGIFLTVLRWRGLLGNPVLLGLGASTGLLAGFAFLFVMARIFQPQAVIASD
jgi:putative peptidoglycan lipid II flippase